MTDQYEVIYSPAALEDLKAIYSYIAYELLADEAAKNQTERIRREIRSLDFFPERYTLVDWEPWASMRMHKVPVDSSMLFTTWLTIISDWLPSPEFSMPDVT